jgi:dipeptidyl aminopeptidase/acylaminoacyl peptidase
MTSAAPLSKHASIAHGLLHDRSTVTDPRLSPDGARVAHTVTTISVERNVTESVIWLDDAPLTAGPHDSSPRWSPDGTRLAFVRRPTGKRGDAQLIVMGVGGPGEPRTLCSVKEAIDDLEWSPDGRWLAFTSRTRDERYDAEDDSWRTPRKVETFFSRLDGENWIFDRPKHLYVIAADGTTSVRNLTPGDHQHAGVSWLADSSGVVTSAQRHDGWDIDLADDLYRVDLDGGIHALTERTGSYGRPSVSPDGARIAFLGTDNPKLYPQNVRVGVMNVDGSGRRWVSEGLDRTFQPTVGTTAPRWLDASSMLATGEDRGATHLYRLTVTGDQPEPLTDGAISVTGFDTADGITATTRSAVDHTAELFVTTGGTDRQVTDLAMSGRGWERFTAPCSDGTDEIDAWIMRPDGFDPAATYPVLLNVHGGPFTQYGDYFFDEAQMQADAGFVVLMSNPRGGSGRHSEWAHAILGPKHPDGAGTGWGTVDVDDVLAVLDTALDRYSFCDPERVGMLGGSYGGYMATLLAARHGDRFGAICSERAVNNLLTEEWSSDIGMMFRVEHGVDPVEDPDEYLRMSPIVLARDIDTPMLIIHSEHDWRCPINQAEELWMTLKWLGRDVTFYRFPGEGHELSRNGSPLHRQMRAEIILDFFAERLAGAD